MGFANSKSANLIYPMNFQPDSLECCISLRLKNIKKDILHAGKDNKLAQENILTLSSMFILFLPERFMDGRDGIAETQRTTKLPRGQQCCPFSGARIMKYSTSAMALNVCTVPGRLELLWTSCRRNTHNQLG